MKHKIGRHFRYVGVTILLVSTLITSCLNKKLTKTPPGEIKPLEKEVFILKPFGYEPNLKNFKMNLPSSFKLHIYSMKNIHNPAVTDTIYKFYQNKSEFLIYKNVNNRELFFGGNIYTNKIKLRNGITIGMTRLEFLNCFSNLKSDAKDTIRLSSKKAPNSMNFIFRNNKLIVIKMDNYID